MRKILAIWATKFAAMFSKLLGKKGSSSPGRIGLKIYPNLLRDLSKGLKIIVTCGTNGKTTTNNLIDEMLRSSQKKVVCNNLGANMLDGVVTAFAMSTGFWGKINAEYAAIEIDEISAVKVFEHFTPECMIVTNMFRDQLDRYGEVDLTMEALAKAIAMVPDVKLILNADDPLAVALGNQNAEYYGIGEKVLEDSNPEVKEGRFCRKCGTELVYSFYHYSQLGHYACDNCGFKRPEVKFEATGVNLKKGLEFEVLGCNIFVNYQGFYNIYNILAAFAGINCLGEDNTHINEVLNAYKPQIGRMESFEIGKPIVFNLSKNPAGFNQAIQTALEDNRKKSVVFVINDNAQDGKDISWIWDVEFENLNDKLQNIAASGIRYNDVMVRLKYAGFDMDRVLEIDDIEAAIKSMLKTDCEVLYVLVNYTALFSTQDILKRLGGAR